MVFAKVCAIAFLLAAVSGTPAKSFWKGTPLDGTIEEMRSACSNDDAISCMKFKFMSFLDNVFKKDNYQITENIEVARNDYHANEVSQRSEKSLEQNVQDYIQTHDVTFKLPVVGSQVTVGARNLDNDELNIKLKFDNDVQARKSKLKKIFVPILVFILLKAMTLIPLALGVLGLKAWNALQLSFFSFVISVALAVFQLCKKIAADNVHPPITAHGWEAATNYAARSFDTEQPSQEDAQQLAYNAYY